ncbi:hypothetical protein BD414DRAFT_506352 [Trametes punicea]|nr:hypothetical protein BD414DRAFT_506352 [Trametes punicea]
MEEFFATQMIGLSESLQAPHKVDKVFGKSRSTLETQSWNPYHAAVWTPPCASARRMLVQLTECVTSCYPSLIKTTLTHHSTVLLNLLFRHYQQLHYLYLMLQLRMLCSPTHLQDATLLQQTGTNLYHNLILMDPRFLCRCSLAQCQSVLKLHMSCKAKYRGIPMEYFLWLDEFSIGTQQDGRRLRQDVPKWPEIAYYETGM